MTFSTAVAVLITGKAIRRESWGKIYHIRLVEGKVSILNEDMLYHPVTFNAEDVKAEDWSIIDNIDVSH